MLWFILTKLLRNLDFFHILIIDSAATVFFYFMSLNLPEQRSAKDLRLRIIIRLKY